MIHGHDPWFHGHDPLQEMTDFWTMSTKMLGPHGLMLGLHPYPSWRTKRDSSHMTGFKTRKMVNHLKIGCSLW